MISRSLTRTVRTKLAGLTLVEMLIAVGIFGVLIAIAAPSLRAPSSRLVANSVQATVQQARFEAIKRNRPVVVELASDGSGVLLSTTLNAGSVTCGGLEQIRKVDITEHGRVDLTSQHFPFIWLPNGQPRACGGAALTAEPTISAVDARGTFVVAVGVGGEVAVR